MISKNIERLLDIKTSFKERLEEYGVSVPEEARLDEYPYYIAKHFSSLDFYFNYEGKHYPSYEGLTVDVKKAGNRFTFPLVCSTAWTVDEEESQLYGAYLYDRSGSGSIDFKVDLPTVDTGTEYLIMIKSEGCKLPLKINQVK